MEDGPDKEVSTQAAKKYPKPTEYPEPIQQFFELLDRPDALVYGPMQGRWQEWWQGWWTVTISLGDPETAGMEWHPSEPHHFYTSVTMWEGGKSFPLHEHGPFSTPAAAVDSVLDLAREESHYDNAHLPLTHRMDCQRVATMRTYREWEEIVSQLNDALTQCRDERYQLRAAAIDHRNRLVPRIVDKLSRARMWQHRRH